MSLDPSGIFFTKFLMILLNWNVRGACGSEFSRIFRLLMNSHKPDLVVLQEPRCSGRRALSTIRKLGFSFQVISEANGFSDGIWILWNRAIYLLRPLETALSLSIWKFLQVMIPFGSSQPSMLARWRLRE